MADALGLPHPTPGASAVATRGTRWVADRCTDLLPDLLRRGGLAIDRVAAELHPTIGALRATGAEVLTACLPDPGSALGLRWSLARPL
ncbi:MAG: hypothetical protein FWE15_22920, partial [Actinomycetia bacterium]|nr:hypothetical protein [Actinomycetes bacterium]